MYRVFCAILLLLAACVPSFAQGALGDVLSGNLVKPAVGQWAWYDAVNSATGEKSVIRQAIVGSERVGSKTGYWLETEVIPTVGYGSVVKILLTGPAENPANIHKIIQKEGPGPVEEFDAPKDAAPSKPAESPKRESLGMETIAIGSEEIEAEHVVLTVGEGTAKTEYWINEDIRPTGIVKMASPQGQLTLRSHGEGGRDAQSVFDKPKLDDVAPKQTETKVEVNVEDSKSSPKKNFAGSSSKKGEGK